MRVTDKRLKQPDAVYQALMDAHAELSERDAERFRARLILLLADRVGDDRAVVEAIATARAGLGSGDAP